jgi:hypothetical protein
MMNKLTPSDLLSLENYARQRADIRQRIIAHKKMRTVHVGPNTTWLFEDREMVQYQIQEMLRAERIFEQQGIQDELDAYNPLIPDGTNWKVTFLIEYPDENERRAALTQLKGIEDNCWVQVTGFDRVFSIADEDLERENEEKTSAVHFMRFELSPAMCEALRSGAAISIGVDHPNYRHEIAALPQSTRDTLVHDLA